MSTQTADRPNKVDVESLGPTRRKIKIVIPRETVNETIGTTLETMLVEAELPGFRKGRAPKRLIEKRFGSVMRRQAKDQLVSQAYQKAVEETKLRIVGEPTSESLANVELEEGKDLSFEIEVEVMPEFELPALENIAVKKPIIPVTDEMVSKELEKLCIQEGSLDERTVAEPGDYLTGHAKMTGKDKSGEEKTFFESDGIVVQAPPADKKGKGMIVGLVVDDLSKQMGLPKPGDTVTVKTKGPDNHEREELRGVDLTVTYTPVRCDRIIPAKAEELAARFGFDGEPGLRDAMKQRLQQRVLVDQQSVMRQQIGRHLLDAVKMDLPERLTANQVERSFQRRRMELMYRGVDPMKIEENIAELRRQSAAAAAGELKMFFILDKAAEQLGVRVSEQEINGRIAQMAMERNERPENLRQQLIKSNQVGAVFQQIREHKTMDAILSKAKVTDVPAEEFAKELANPAAS
ncbi:MAG: trigger factor [Phycisphaerales bacterium]